jgi:hypothetical protein
LDNDELNFFVQGNSYLNDYIKEYIYQLVDFIKSYTIHVRNMDTMYIFDDRFSNCILYFDEAHIETDFAVPDLISVSDDVFNALTEMEVEPEQVMHEVEEFIFFQHNLKAYEHDLELSSLYKMFTSLKQSDIFVLLANKTDYRNFISEIEYCNHLDDYTTYSNISLKQKLLIDIRDIMFKYFDTKSELVSLLESTDIDNIYTIDLTKLVVSDKYEYLMNLILTDGHVVHFSKDKLIVDLTTCSYSENLGFSEDIYSIYEENHVEKLNIKESLTIESTVYENIFGFTDLINYCLIYEDMNIMRFDLNRLLNQNGIFQDLPENVIAIKNFGNVVFYYSEDGNKYYDFTYKDGILVLSKLHGPIRYVLLANAKIQYRNK